MRFHYSISISGKYEMMTIYSLGAPYIVSSSRKREEKYEICLLCLITNGTPSVGRYKYLWPVSAVSVTDY